MMSRDQQLVGAMPATHPHNSECACIQLRSTLKKEIKN